MAMSTADKPYNFDEQLEIGAKHEHTLDLYFLRFFEVKAVPMELQKLGLDRIFTYKGTPKRRLSVEYKADEMAGLTNNAFIETLSNSSNGKLGWAYTSVAQLLVYYVPPMNRAAVINMVTLRDRLHEWTKKYQKRCCKNETYYSEGYLVPLHEIRKIAMRMLTVPRV